MHWKLFHLLIVYTDCYNSYTLKFETKTRNVWCIELLQGKLIQNNDQTNIKNIRIIKVSLYAEHH